MILLLLLLGFVCVFHGGGGGGGAFGNEWNVNSVDIWLSCILLVITLESLRLFVHAFSGHYLGHS